MAEVTDVDIVGGIPTGGTGTVPTLSKTNTLTGAVTETAPATDTASSGLNGRLQRIAQHATAQLRGTFTNRSTTITLGGTSQQLAAANAARARLLVQNPSSATESVFVNFGADAVADSNSVELPPGERLDQAGPVSTDAIHVIAATTGHVVIAKEM